jgi:hypothetical protein
MSFWMRGRKGSRPAPPASDAGQVQKRKRPVKRSPPVAMEVKLLALEALESGLSAQEVGELVSVWGRRAGEREEPHRAERESAVEGSLTFSESPGPPDGPWISRRP